MSARMKIVKLGFSSFILVLVKIMYEFKACVSCYISQILKNEHLQQLGKKRPMHACYASASQSMQITIINITNDVISNGFYTSLLNAAVGPKKRSRMIKCPRLESDTHLWPTRHVRPGWIICVRRGRGPLSCGAPRPRPHQCQRSPLLLHFDRLFVKRLKCPFPT